MPEGTKEQTVIVVALILGVLFSLWIMMTFLEKLLGLALVILGVLILLGFSDRGGGAYQTKHFWLGGKTVAIIMILAGIALLVLG